MNWLAKMKAKAEATAAKQRALVEAAGEAPFTTEQQAEFDALQKEFDGTMLAVERAALVNGNSAKIGAVKADPTQSGDVTGNIRGVTGNDSVPAEPARKVSPTEMLGIAGWAAMKSKIYSTKSAVQHVEEAGLQKIADQFRETEAQYKRTLLSTTSNGGDNMIFTPLSSDWLETLRNDSVILSNNPLMVDMSEGSLKFSGGNASVTGTYTTEGADAAYVQLTTRNITMSAKYVKAVTAFGNYLAERSPFNVAAIVGADLQAGFMLGVDNAGYRGDGTGNNPSGVYTLTAAGNKLTVGNTTATPTYAQVDVELKRALTKLASSNVPRRRIVCLMNPRVKYQIQFTKDGNGNFAYPGLNSASPTILEGIPVVTSNVIPINLGVGTDESEIGFVDFGHFMMGNARAMQIAASNEASYKDGSNTMQSAFSREETVLRASAAHDFGTRYDTAHVFLTAVRWGA